MEPAAGDGTGGAADGPAATVAPRPASRVMQLPRLGSLHQSRLSFARTLVRRMARERWRIERERFELDDQGVGVAVYAVRTPRGRLSFVAFADALAPHERTDRVIATRWDATFALVDGDADAATVRRLGENVPRQEAGRLGPGELVLSRANKSVRLFEHVVSRLAAGEQPGADALLDVGYLMRTTAVYGNGKFGLCDLDRLQCAGVFTLPFQAEMLTVYLARHFSIDLVEHAARCRDPARAVALARPLRRTLGVGNATGLGMAPFLVTHPKLLQRWIAARETALARVRAVDAATDADRRRFRTLLERARAHLGQWHTDDARQGARVRATMAEVDALHARMLAAGGDWLAGARPFDALVRSIEGRVGSETEELIVSLLIEMFPRLVDALENDTGGDEDEATLPRMRLGELQALLEHVYGWALETDFAAAGARSRFWYVSQDKEEPRLGERGVDAGDDREMRVDVARQVSALHAALAALEPGTRRRTVAWWLLREPRWRGIVRRVQSLAGLPYAEIRANLLAADCLPIDLLRCKLAIFGASKFDPKSDRWTRITLFQGAPLADELDRADADDWWMPVLPPPAPARGGRARPS